MAKSTIVKEPINLVYIRAAVEAATGIRLTLEQTRSYLIEEGLISKSQARRYAQIFRGYDDFYEDYTRGYVPPAEDPKELTAIIGSKE